MRSLLVLLSFLAAIQVLGRHVIPCWRLDNSARSAAARGEYVEAIRIPERVLLRRPCLCPDDARSALSAAFVNSALRILEKPDPNLRSAAALEAHYRQMAQQHALPENGRVAQLLGELRSRQFEQANAESDRGNDSSALRLLATVAAAYPDAETQARLRREETSIRYRYASRLSGRERLEEALAELSRVVRSEDAPPRIREQAGGLAAEISARIMRSHVKAGDFAAAWKTVQETRGAFPGAPVEELLETFDVEVFGRPLRSGALPGGSHARAVQPPPGGRVAELRIANATGVTLCVVLRGPTRTEFTLARGAQGAIRILPGTYLVGAYVPERGNYEAHRANTKFQVGRYAQRYVLLSAGRLEPAAL